MVLLFTHMNPLSLQPTFDNSPQSKVTSQNSPTSIQDRPDPPQHQPPDSPTPRHQPQNRPTLHKQFTYPPDYKETLPTPFAVSSRGMYKVFNTKLLVARIDLFLCFLYVHFPQIEHSPT